MAIPVWWVMDNFVKEKKGYLCLKCYYMKDGVLHFKGEKQIRKHIEKKHIGDILAEVL